MNQRLADEDVDSPLTTVRPVKSVLVRTGSAPAGDWECASRALTLLFYSIRCSSSA